MDASSRFDLHGDRVRPEWIDSMGHMNIAYYLLAYDRAIDGFFGAVGCGDDYKAREGHTFWTLELHITYERELRDGQPIGFDAQLLGFDDKRIHVFFRMVQAAEGYLASTLDASFIHVDFAARCSAPILPSARAMLERCWETHRLLPKPPQVGRVIGLKSGQPAGLATNA
ncbi:MAG: thioesterase-like protein [Alphaproteobacteria bacterium]|nr:thioesterase-like protein [Alphaproteobacteria bacterium]